MTPARFLFVEVTTECNLRCRQCHMWRSREPEDSLSCDEKVGLVEQLAAWSPGATVVLTGGETMRKPHEFFRISAACRRLGLSSAANTNGSLIDPTNLDRLLTEGPRYLVISLDSHQPEQHDWLRGAPGLGEHVIEMIRALVARKRTAYPGTDVRIMTNTVLFDGNLVEIGELVRFIAALGVDGIMFQALSRTFLHHGNRDVFFEEHFPRDPSAFDLAVNALLELQAAGAPIVTAATDLRWMRLYARDPDFIGEQVCGSGERNLMVDQRGDVQLCFSMRGLLDGAPLGNVRGPSLQELWESDLAARARERMSGCRKNCGMLNCHRRIVE
jgi:MoaA/NifB/PqqE/SkfB family radical SAM enzyme